MPTYQLAMTAYRRANYLRESLFSLANNDDLTDCQLHFSLEPGDEEVLGTCEFTRFMPTEIHINPHVYGVTGNPYEMLKRMFERGAEHVIYLEDDVLLAPDAIRMAKWFFNLPAETCDAYLCLTFYNNNSSADADICAIQSGQNFSALGMAITKYQWENYFAPNWHANPAGWDHSIQALTAERKTLFPAISRSHHIGRHGGTWYNASRHDVIYCTNPMSTQLAPEFRIVTA